VLACHRQACDAPTSPGRLKIETAGNAINIQAFACEVKARDFAAFHCPKVNFFEAYPAAGHKFVLVGGLYSSC